MVKAISVPKLGLAVVAASLLALPPHGAVQPSHAASPRAASTLVVNFGQAPNTLDPSEGCDLNTLGILGNLYVLLTQYRSQPGPNGTTQEDSTKIVPYFAKSWTISPNGLVYKLTLHSGVKFPSGRPVDAAAVKYTFDRALAMGSCASFFVNDDFSTPLIKSIQVVNPTSLVITLRQRDPNILQTWAQPSLGIVDPSVVQAHGGVQANKVNEWMASHAAGAGPYLLQSYEPNSKAVLVANPTYFGKPPATSKIIINFINSDATLLLQARSGNADVTMGLSKQSVHSLLGNSSVRIIANNTAASEQIGLPWSNPPFNNLQFRTALTYAVPYQQILSKVAFGYGSIFYGPFPAAMREYNAGLEKPRPFDLAQAQALIKASGVATPVNFNMAIAEGDPIGEQIGTIIQGIWQQLGINVTISKLSQANYDSALFSHKVQSYIRYDGPSVIDAGYYLGYDMQCSAGANLSDICIPQADALTAQARATANPVQRQALWNRITQLWVAKSPKITVYADQYTTVLNKRVKTFFYSHDFDFRTWSK
ncbi:MAG: hypothetical protein JWO42_4171 [Chloroflexi bacterium]|nr:hypothetical protein [Chloroflexota bacterium]